MEENTSKSKTKSSNKNKGKKLPWWIELFFVQIGLPERLLLKYLNLDKKAKQHFENNRYEYKIMALLGIIMFYFSPLVNQSRQKNYCISKTVEYMKDNNVEQATSKAMNFCNGGESNEI